MDVLFGMTLPRVIRSKFKTDGELHVIPEFPIKTGTDQRTFNVDFAVLTPGGDRVFLVELKTDSRSIKPKQLCRMRDKGLRPFGELVKDICDVAKASDQGSKYNRLITELRRAGVDVGPGAENGGKPELVLVYPSHADVRSDMKYLECFSRIDFEEYASTITPSLEETFAHYLRKWQSEAGKPD